MAEPSISMNSSLHMLIEPDIVALLLYLDWYPTTRLSYSPDIADMGGDSSLVMML